MEQEVPSWLNETFIATVLQGGEHSTEDKGVTVVKLTVKPALPPGTNYTSKIYRLHIEYKVGQSSDLQTISLIVKAPLETGVLNDFSYIYTTEPKIYSDLLPKMSEKVKCEFGAKSFYSPIKNVIVLKDLKPEGYVLADRFKQLDFQHCKQVFTTLAKFHATSVAIHHENSMLIETLGDERFYKHGGEMEEEMKLMLISSFNIFTEILNEMGDQYSLAEYFSKRVDSIWESIVNLCTPRKDKLNVLNHGDCWTNNMLFKYSDSGEVVDVKLLDFQIVRYGSPMLDIIYFLWSSGNEEVRDSSQQELFKIYVDTLNQTLEDHGCEERLTYEDFQEDLKSYFDWILSAICVIVPFQACDPENVMDIGEIETDGFKNGEMNEKFKKMCSSRVFRTRLPGLQRQLHNWISSQFPSIK